MVSRPPGENLSSRSGRRGRTRLFLLGGVAFGALGPHVVLVSQRLGGMAMWLGEADAGVVTPDGGGTSRRRPRSPLQRRSYGAGPSPGEVWVAIWCCTGSKCVGPAGSAPGNAEFDLVATPGRRPRIWRDVEVCGRSSLARVARATRRLGCAALWLVCGFGAEWCKSGRRPRGWWRVLCRSVD